MPRIVQDRRTVSMRRCVYDAISKLAEQRGETLASMMDRLASAELAAAGVEVPAYTALPRRVESTEPKKRRSRAKPRPEALPVPERLPTSVVTKAIDDFNRERAYTPARPTVTLRPEAMQPLGVEGSVQSQHIEL